MKIRTDIKSGGQGIQHNEKLTSNIEQKKALGTKLRLSKETIRELKDSDLKAVAGGAAPTTGGYTMKVYWTCNC